ncbi:MAG: hypothetical protein BWK80_23280 [Desulfobacteraceae bacterium IS3]|nr:MAG: hypothetical protein BWK80_23280 [Desulfobacteraceae bacterium IS3]
MKKIAKIALLLVMVAGILVNTSWAAPVSQDTAKKVALNWMNEKSNKGFTSGDVSAPTDAKRDSSTPYYIFNFNSNGWAIISGDDVAYPVIAYSETGAYTNTTLPPAFEEWMNNISQQVSSSSNKTLRSSDNPKAKVAWDRLSVAPENFVPQKDRRENSVEPLLGNLQWNQSEYYNALSPADSLGRGSDGHAYAGCVATAMAQVMKYHRYPERGTGSYSYDDLSNKDSDGSTIPYSAYGRQSADFGSATYNWSTMPDSLSSYNNDVATLLYHVGVSVNMNYGPKGSGANVDYNAKNALINYFKYDRSLYYASKAKYSGTDWINLLKSELNAARPIIYVGYGTGGHAFVCDGYKDADYFHFNWGWGGYLDGFFLLNDLTPGSSNFNNTQGGLMGVKPAVAPTPTCTFNVTPESRSFDAAGGTGTISVSVASGCSWTSVSDSSWITITSGSSGNGYGTVYYSVGANLTASSRTGTITIGGKTVVISQAAGKIPPEPPPIPKTECSYYAVSPEFSHFTTSGGNGTINVTAASGCSWDAVSNADWIMLLGSSGTGNGMVMYSVTPNSSFMPRTGTVSIEDKTFTITQEAVSCYRVISGVSISVLRCGGTIKLVIQVSVISWGTDCPPLRIIINDSWLALSSEETAQRDDTTITHFINVEPNPDSTPRSTTIYVEGEPVTINQEGSSHYKGGVFTVDETGIVTTDWLYDGGRYQGEFGIFNLTGMESLTPGSPEFIAEAAKRVLSNSNQGYLVFSDLSEGARFSGLLGGEAKDWNTGDYKGLKNFAMTPGTQFATILVPNSTFVSLAQNPETEDPNKRPLFSLVSSNPAYGMYLGQMTDINGMGKAYSYEDKDAATSDWDFNDLIVQITGAESDIPTIDSLNVTRSDSKQKRDGFADWRTDSELGRLIMSHVELAQTTNPITVTLKGSATLLVFDAQGEVIGKSGGTLVGANFAMTADSQTVTLPDTGSYRIVIQGVKAETCLLSVKDAQGNLKEIQVDTALHQVFSTSTALETPTASASYDFNGDGTVDNTDVGMLVKHWNSCKGQQKYDAFFDVNDDGCITVADIMTVLNAKTVN